MGLEGRALAVVHGEESTLACYDLAAGREMFRAPTGPRPQDACLSHDRRLLYVTGHGRPGTDPDAERGHAIDVFDLRRRKSVASIPLGRHLRPCGIAVHSGGRLFVTCEEDETLLVLRLEDESLHKAVPLAAHQPRAVAVSPDGRTAFTANSASGSVSGIDVMMGVVLRTLDLGGRPEGLAFAPEGGTLYVALPEQGRIALVDAARIEAVGEIETGPCPVRVAVTPDGARLAVLLHHGQALEIVDTATRQRTHTIPIDGPPTHLSLSHDGELAFASCGGGRIEVVSLADARILRELATRGTLGATVPLTLAEVAGGR
jgi:DNA-binding beta-propeller fold protein YncE